MDPHTAQLTVTTDPLPQIIDGIPADLRPIDAVIDRPEFMFNPTNCDPQRSPAPRRAPKGASAPISSHFQVAVLPGPDVQAELQGLDVGEDLAKRTGRA